MEQLASLRAVRSRMIREIEWVEGRAQLEVKRKLAYELDVQQGAARGITEESGWASLQEGTVGRRLGQPHTFDRLSEGRS